MDTQSDTRVKLSLCGAIFRIDLFTWSICAIFFKSVADCNSYTFVQFKASRELFLNWCDTFPANASETAEFIILGMSLHDTQWSVWCPMFTCFHVFMLPYVLTFSRFHGTFKLQISVKRYSYSSYDSLQEYGRLISVGAMST